MSNIAGSNGVKREPSIEELEAEQQGHTTEQSVELKKPEEENE